MIIIKCVLLLLRVPFHPAQSAQTPTAIPGVPILSVSTCMSTILRNVHADDNYSA